MWASLVTTDELVAEFWPAALAVFSIFVGLAIFAEMRRG